MKKYRLYLLCGLMILLTAACNKDSRIDPNNIAFVEKTKEQQQKTLTTYLEKFAGKKYKLRSRITYDKSGEYVTQDSPSECEKDIYIEFPEQLNADQYIAQIPTNPSCGLASDRNVPFAIFESPFKNYQWEINMFSVIRDSNTEAIFRGFVLIQPGVDVKNPDIADYLEILEPFIDDLKEADRAPGTIDMLPYRKYTFARVN